MKYIFRVGTIIFIVLIMAGITYANKDRKGSSDHPLISRMPNFWIASYKDIENDSYTFRDSANNKINIEGHKYFIEYRLKKGGQEPGRLMILNNHENALKKIDAEIFKRTKKDLYCKVTKEGKEIWIQIRALDSLYRLTIVEREQVQQKTIDDPDESSEDTATSVADIHEAAKSGTLDEVKALIAKGEKLNAKDDRDLTPLYYAASAGHKEICLFLIDQGADVNAAPEPFYTPLYAAFNQRNKNAEEIFKLLVERGADFRMIVGGYTLIHNAALSCHDESQLRIAEFLISKGVDINAKGHKDKTPLHMVGCRELGELLISKGADIEARDKNGRTPLFEACSSIRSKKQICELLLSKGADVNARDNRGWTPLRQALKNKHKDVAAFLKKHEGVE
jgi:ankyrin repeat protein